MKKATINHGAYSLTIEVGRYVNTPGSDMVGLAEIKEGNRSTMIKLTKDDVIVLSNLFKDN